MKKEFKRVFKESKPDAILPELGIFQEKVNFCSNVNLKKFLMLFEKLSDKYKVRKTSFRWSSCFGVENENYFCSEEVKKTFAKYPEMANTIVKILNGKHYTHLNSEYLMTHVIEILGNTLDSSFDRVNIIGNFGQDITKTEK